MPRSRRYLLRSWLAATSILYIRTKQWRMLLLVDVQLFHIYWITDAIILSHASLNPVLAWAAIHMAAPGAALTPGVHGPVAAFGLDTLSHGAAESGLHEVDDPPC